MPHLGLKSPAGRPCLTFFFPSTSSLLLLYLFLHSTFRLLILRMAPAPPKSNKPSLARPPDRTLASTSTSTSHNSLETLPVEVIHHILSYLVHPRSRLPGLTECQSNFDFSRTEQRKIKGQEDQTAHPDSNRHFTDVFSWVELRHPFNVLASTSRRCRELVDNYCSHLVRACNMFNLPFAHLEAHGPNSVYPDLRHIVFRRLWLQTAPRHCVFCGGNLSSYPHSPTMRLMLTCEDCFYAQTLVSTFVPASHCHAATDYHVRRSKRYKGYTISKTAPYSLPIWSAALLTTSGSFESTSKH